MRARAKGIAATEGAATVEDELPPLPLPEFTDGQLAAIRFALTVARIDDVMSILCFSVLMDAPVLAANDLFQEMVYEVFAACGHTEEETGFPSPEGVVGVPVSFGKLVARLTEEGLIPQPFKDELNVVVARTKHHMLQEAARRAETTFDEDND